MKGKIRSLKMLVLLSILAFVDIFLNCIKGNFNLNDIPAILVGSFCGLILALILLRRSSRFAKRGIFVEPPSKRYRNIILGVTFILFFTLGITIGIINKYHYWVGSYLSILLNVNILTFFLFVFTTIGALGIYILECRYGQKYYFGKMEQKSC